MVWNPSLLALDGGSGWMNDYGWALLALVGAFTVSLYVWSYLNKNIDEWRSREGKYFDSEVLDYARRMAQALIVALLLILAFVVASFVANFNDEPWWGAATRYVFDALLVLVIVVLAGFAVKVLRRISRRSRMTSDGAGLPSALEFSSLLLSYVVYILSTVLVLLIVLSALTDLQTTFDGLGNFLVANEQGILVTLAIVIGIAFVIKLVENILEDFKFRSKKFNPQVIELLKDGIKYSLVTIAFLVVLFNIFLMIDMELVGILLVIVTLVFLVLAIGLSYSAVQNIVSGLALMDTSPFEVGDRIRVADGLMCDVIDKGLVFTKVKTMDGELVDIPNMEIIQGRIYNYSRASSHAIDVLFEVSFGIPHERVSSYVREAVCRVEGVAKDPKPEVRAVEIKGHSIMYEVVVYSKDVQKDPQIRSDIIFQIQEIFQTEGHKSLVD
ncbi:mechanosensitive ion channel family protein [Methanomassiliicoccus luminyensis]|uniref:mechanosensitive ion channel family protein n=1 Tax=Methanomassiliicoccus luminyensis TaxID=1080712 RepID=UPI0003694E8D|nr:mechanosensitive ion channel domain-containing protein [Methanomassiliicoccus luminyensis]